MKPERIPHEKRGALYALIVTFGLAAVIYRHREGSRYVKVSCADGVGAATALAPQVAAEVLRLAEHALSASEARR